MRHSHQIMAAIVVGASLMYLFNWITGLGVGWSWAAVCVSTVVAEMIFGD